MFIAAAIVAILLAAALCISAVGKLTKMDGVMETVVRTVGWPEDRLWFLALIEFAGAAGLIIGLFWAPLGIAAAIGVALYFAGAVIGHLRVHDAKGSAPAAFLGLLAVVEAVLRSLSA